MSLEAILTAIEASGQAEVAGLRAETEARIRDLLAEAERTAAAKHEAARRAALRPACGERARLLQHAKIEALHIQGEARDLLIESALTEARCRLARLRADPDYRRIVCHLTEELICALGDEPADDGRPVVLEVDPRDEALLRSIVCDLGLDLPITPSLSSWGGLAARSGDGRIVAMNTLEARLERAAPYLRRDLAAFFEQCLTSITATPACAR